MSCQILRDIAPDSNQTAFGRKISRQNAISGRTDFVKSRDDGGMSFTLPRPGQNNPLVFTDPTGLLSLYLHGGGPGTTGNGGAGSANMVGYAYYVEKVLNTGKVVMPNFSYLPDGTNKDYFAHDTKNAIQALREMDWDRSGNNKIVGFSVGADVTAQFLLETDVHFKLAIIDATITDNLSADKLAVLASKADKLVIVSHTKDYMNGNIGSEALGGGDRLLDGSTDGESETLDEVDWQGNVKIIRPENDHTIDAKKVASEL